jgi:hypothetical protein
MNEEEEEDLRDHYYDHIVRQRTIPRRTNWRHHANALSQCEVALATSIQSSANEYVSFIFILLFFIQQMMMAISAARRAVIGGPEPSLIRRM